MEIWHKIKDKLMDEAKRVSHELSKKDRMSATDIDYIQKLSSAIKDIDKICMLESDNEYSERRYSRDTMRGSYDDDSSYRSRHWVTGHYSRDGHSDNMDGMSERRVRDGRYSHGSIADEIMRMRNEATNDMERRTIDKCLEIMKDY